MSNCDVIVRVEAQAGFFHLFCLTKYAAIKSERWDGRDMNKFVEPWQFCPGCQQYYQNELAIDIATKFVRFVRRQYPCDTLRQVEALNRKLRAFNSMLERLTAEQKREAGVTANVMLSLIDRIMKEISPPLPRRYSQMKADAYNVHGRIAFNEGTEESARRAALHLRIN